MPGFDGTGPRGMGPMTGGGRGFCSPWGRGMWAVPWRYGAYGQPYQMRPAYEPTPYYGQITHQQEIDLLKEQAQALKNQLDQIEASIDNLEKQP